LRIWANNWWTLTRAVAQLLFGGATMRIVSHLQVRVLFAGLLLSGVLAGAWALEARGEGWRFGKYRENNKCSTSSCDDYPGVSELGGTWYWMRSPDQEKRHVIGLYNRYCIRCHGVDGRGIWDIPDAPNFTNVRWQESRSDARIAHIIIEGRGAVMPPFRGAISLEESWAIARYIRTLVPGTEVPKPDFVQPEKIKSPKPTK
jgi:hypothetical protein